MIPAATADQEDGPEGSSRRGRSREFLRLRRVEAEPTVQPSEGVTAGPLFRAGQAPLGILTAYTTIALSLGLRATDVVQLQCSKAERTRGTNAEPLLPEKTRNTAGVGYRAAGPGGGSRKTRRRERAGVLLPLGGTPATRGWGPAAGAGTITSGVWIWSAAEPGDSTSRSAEPALRKKLEHAGDVEVVGDLYRACRSRRRQRGSWECWWERYAREGRAAAGSGVEKKDAAGCPQKRHTMTQKRKGQAKLNSGHIFPLCPLVGFFRGLLLRFAGPPDSWIGRPHPGSIELSGIRRVSRLARFAGTP